MFGNSRRKRRLDVRVVAVGVLPAAAFLVMASGAVADRRDEGRDRPDRSNRTRWRNGATGASERPERRASYRALVTDRRISRGRKR